MTDSLLNTLQEESPIPIEQLEIDAVQADHLEFTLPTGHDADELTIVPPKDVESKPEGSALIFHRTISCDEIKTERFLQIPMLSGIPPAYGTTPKTTFAATEHWARLAEKPAFWVTTNGDSITIQLEADSTTEKRKVPKKIILHERVPVADTIETIDDLNRTLSGIFGESITVEGLSK